VIGNRPVRGSNTAQLLLVEFTDYQCPYCSKHVRETFPKIAEEYIDKGVIRYAVADQPLPTHIMAAKAAEASRCAGEQGKYWEYHNIAMAKQEWIEDLSSYAISLKLNIDRYEECLKTNRYIGEIEKDISLAKQFGISGVPGFILAYNDPNNLNRAKAISYIRGAQSFSNFQKEFERALLNNNDRERKGF
jgi:protein-disulfide isomerase